MFQAGLMWRAGGSILFQGHVHFSRDSHAPIIRDGGVGHDRVAGVVAGDPDKGLVGLGQHTLLYTPAL